MTKVFLASATALAFLAGSQVPGEPGSAGLTSIASEIKLLRTSIEKSTESQVQIQAISVYLTNEQGRLTQLANRLDGIRRDLDSAASDSREAAAQVTTLEAALASNKIPPQMVPQYEQQLAESKRSAELKSQTESQLRARETLALQEFQTDRDQYTAMVARLQQFIK